MNKKCLLILGILFLLAFSGGLRAQYLENDSLPSNRFFWGGDLGLSFGSYTYFAVNPIVGYRLTNRLSAGVGVNYTYSSYDYYNYKGSMYGGNTFASYTIVKNIGDILPIYEGAGILLYGEYSILNISDYYDFPGTSIKWVGTSLAGVAFQTPIGPKSYAMLMILYNFSESRINPYPNPVIKACVQF
jgi:hypothetical protein